MCDRIALPAFVLTVCILAAPTPTRAGGDCPCNGDVTGDGIVNLLDLLCILDCVAGDCACCVNSCDINCDGVVDNQDGGPGPFDDSAWYCLFQGGPPDTCCPGPTGACCDLNVGQCDNDVLEADCTGAGLAWTEGATCSPATCPTPPTGACCDLSVGDCQADVVEVNCAGAQDEWTEGATCAQVSCPAPPNGACCNRGNGSCQGSLEVECTGPDREWHEGTGCPDVDCSVPGDPGPCECNGDVTGDGIVNLFDLLCILDCVAGDCTCCVDSCDINCDGVVDNQDGGPEPFDDSAWYCLFQGGSPDTCCPEAPSMLRHNPLPQLRD